MRITTCLPYSTLYAAEPVAKIAALSLPSRLNQSASGLCSHFGPDFLWEDAVDEKFFSGFSWSEAFEF